MKNKLLLSSFLLTLLLVSGSLVHTISAQTTCPTLPTDKGIVTLSASVTETNTYAIWSRVLAPDTTNNSFFLQIDDTCGILVGDSSITPNIWTWINTRDGSTNKITAQLSSGSHIIRLYGRENSVGVDKLLLLSNLTCTPQDLGDNCSISPTATVAPVTPTSTPPAVIATPSPTTIPPTTFPTPTPTKIPPTATPVVSTTKIVIYAAGTSGGGAYPSMQLKIKGNTVGNFINIQGNPATRTFQPYTYTYPQVLNRSDIRVAFTNDYRDKKGDRNLYIDRILLNTTTYQTEASTTYSTGTYSSSSGCAPGYKLSEALHCNGYFQF